MKYDIRLELEYLYQPPVAAGRHLVRVTPLTVNGVQRVVASSIVFDPSPVERGDARDFFGNAVVAVAYREPHARFKVGMTARVLVDAASSMLDVSPDLATLRRELNGVRSLAADSPHHFTVASPRVALDDAITAYAGERRTASATVIEIVAGFGERIHREFRFDGNSTNVDTLPKQAFAIRRGVCQDFTHVMIAGLRGIGIPAGYVSGYLRTVPPPGKERLAGADAMHAWVRAWCGNEAGWIGYDPTNGTFAGEDHIAVAIGRDYEDVAPIAGVLRTAGRQRTSQSVDVVPV
jgi:transglutaminase-like putative cysteine protease